MTRSYMDNSPRNRTMTFSGKGQVYAAPDTAVIRLGTQTTGSNLVEIQSANATIMQTIIQVLQRMGVTNVKTYQYSIDKLYDYENGRQIDRGYSVRNIVEIRTSNMDMAGNIIDASVNAGANVVELIAFEASNMEMYYQQALNLAVLNAMQKASSVAMNLRLGSEPEIVKITENSPFPVQPYQREALFAAPTPIIPGELLVEAYVTAEFIF
ncbi:MAG: SIMPL domain-containing protein [Sedimentibacter sp.]|uniref:SIMPL domain-containing protein n=1 Tax=Sedimentibacter sp. TaxID=1960295 RepID=UPI003158ACF0